MLETSSGKQVVYLNRVLREGEQGIDWERDPGTCMDVDEGVWYREL